MRDEINLKNMFATLLPSSQALPPPSSPRTGPTWVTLPWGAVLPAQPAPSCVSHMVASSTRKCPPAWSPLSIGLQVPARSLIQHRLLMGSKPSFRHSPAPTWVSSMDCRRISAPSLPSMGCFALHGLQENLNSSIWSTSFPRFSTDSGVQTRN